VKLTRQQYQNLEQYLVDFRARLNKTTTREEAVPIFKEAVVELNKYGLLPRGMSVERAQRLVTGLYQNTKLANYVEKLLNPSKSLLAEGKNAFCLLCGKGWRNTYFVGPILKMLCGLSIFLRGGLWMITILLFLISNPSIVGWPYFGVLPYFGGVICYGETDVFTGHDYPAEGSIWTLGLLGVHQWNGSFYGNLLSIPIIFYSVTYPGVNGFTGLRLHINSIDFYFGTALNVNVGPNCP
jgi:hypothetical protein